jgi:hypothetical protein
MWVLIANYHSGNLADVGVRFRGDALQRRIRKSVPVFFVVRRLGLYELPVRFSAPGTRAAR